MRPTFLDASLLFDQTLTLRGGAGRAEVVTATVVDVDGDGRYSEGDLLLAFDANHDGHADCFEVEAATEQALGRAAGGRPIDKEKARALGLSLVDPSRPTAPGGWPAVGVGELEAGAGERLSRAELWVDPQRARVATYELVDPALQRKAVSGWKAVERAGLALCGLGVLGTGVALVAGVTLLPVLPLAVAVLGVALQRKASDEVLSALLTTDASPILDRVEHRSR